MFASSPTLDGVNSLTQRKERVVMSELPLDNQGNPVNVNVVMATWKSAEDIADDKEWTPSHVQYLCREGRVRGFKIGMKWYVDPQSVEEYEPKPKGRKPKDHS